MTNRITRAGRKALAESLIVSESDEMAAVLDQVEDAAESDAPVLIEGEPGTGRELVARTIHYAGPRRGGEFVAIKATNIPRSLLDDELFGRSGPFGSAGSGGISGSARHGTLRRANGGTLLLKDLDTIPRGPQRGLAKIIRRREGKDRRDDSTGETFDVRVIGAVDGGFEDDVFDPELKERIGQRKISIPPLRKRAADLPRLVRHFVDQACDEKGRAKVTISDPALERLARYPWPGNVAELKDVTRKLVARLKRSPISSADVEAVLPQVSERIPVEDMALEEMVRAKLKGFLRRVEGYSVDNLYEDVIARVERPLLDLVMEHAHQNQLKASQILGLNRNTLRKKLAEHGIQSTTGESGNTPSSRKKR